MERVVSLSKLASFLRLANCTYVTTTLYTSVPHLPQRQRQLKLQVSACIILPFSTYRSFEFFDFETKRQRISRYPCRGACQIFKTDGCSVPRTAVDASDDPPEHDLLFISSFIHATYTNSCRPCTKEIRNVRTFCCPFTIGLTQIQIKTLCKSSSSSHPHLNHCHYLLVLPCTRHLLVVPILLSSCTYIKCP